MSLYFRLDREQDPLAMLLIIDFLAIRAEYFDYLIAFYRENKVKLHLDLLPNWRYSIALAKFSANFPDDATLLLVEAIQSFPRVLSLLNQKCMLGISAPQTDVNDLCRPLHNLEKLYVERTELLWKVSLLGPFVSNAFKIATRLHERTAKYEIKLNFYRHLLSVDFPGLNFYIPPEIASASIRIYDLLPPPASEASYADVYWKKNKQFIDARGAMGRILDSVTSTAAGMLNFLRRNEEIIQEQSGPASQEEDVNSE